MTWLQQYVLSDTYALPNNYNDAYHLEFKSTYSLRGERKNASFG